MVLNLNTTWGIWPNNWGDAGGNSPQVDVRSITLTHEDVGVPIKNEIEARFLKMIGLARYSR